MKNTVKRLFALSLAVLLLFALAMPALAAEASGETEAAAAEDNLAGTKAVSAAAVVALAAATGAIGMSWAIVKSVESIARQPEAEGKIRTAMMLGLVFVETCIIYALVIAILIVFVL